MQSELGLHLRGVDHCIDQLSPFGVVHYGKNDARIQQSANFFFCNFIELRQLIHKTRAIV